MERKKIPELTYLLSDVEKKYGRTISTSTDFETLSVVIEHQIGELISASTLKRIWGYVSLTPTPRIATLSILSRYVGYGEFKAYCENLKESDIFSSTFFTSRYIAVSDLKKGAEVTIGWNPNRLVTLSYLGDCNFEVKDSVNSQLKPEDRFEITEIIIGYPLFISRILRNGEYTPSFVAGKQGGITSFDIREERNATE